MLKRILGRIRISRTRRRRRRDWYEAPFLSRFDDGSRRWWRPSYAARALVMLAVAGDLALLVWVVVRSLGMGGRLLDAVSVIVAPVLLLAPPYSIFLFWRWHRVKRWYWKRAREHPELLVPTSGSILGEVIGRDQLCEVLIKNVRNPETRRPNVLVGGVGAGKTAVLVQMTKLLADRRAFPIAIRLRDADRPLDFERMAFDRFKIELNDRLFVEASADQMWRQLRKENRVVVLADGLDEALPDSDDRETAIRLAIRNASEHKLPLIIASRPHDPLRALEGALSDLEPLGEGPALDYLTEGTQDNERRTLTRLVQMADISAAPLYLQLLHEMVLVRRRQGPEGGRDWLSSVTGDVRDGVADRIEIRVRLLREWRNLLEQGYLYEDYALNETLRRRTIDVLGALACIGLSNDEAEVSFTQLTSGSSEDIGTPQPVRKEYEPIKLKLKVLLNPPGSTRTLVVDESLCSMAATMGSELGIVEAREKSVRFRHSLIQAYLGSQFLDKALTCPGYVDRALDKCGHEFLIAAVMHSRGSGIRDQQNQRSDEHSDPETVPKQEPPESFWNALQHQARTHSDRVKRLQMYTAMLEIDSYQNYSAGTYDQIVQSVHQAWPEFQSGDVQDRTLLDARIELVHELGRSARRLAAEARRSSPNYRDFSLNYPDFFSIGVGDEDEPVRLMVAREIGEGGLVAYKALAAKFDEWWTWWDRRWRSDCAAWKEWTAGVDTKNNDDTRFREGSLCAQLAPLLLQPVGGTPSNEDWTVRSVTNLKRWLRDFLPAFDSRCPEKRPWISMEIALAQGFKLAGNRRPMIADPQHHRAALVEYAEEALKHSRFWFAQLTLIQALTLCSLPADPGAPPYVRGHGSDPRAHVDHWMRIAGSGLQGASSRSHALHPLVHEAAELARKALITRRPHLFCWMDETDTVGQVGSVSPPEHRLHEFQQWILPSTGWSVLDPRARQLLGDVVLLLSLSSRGDTPMQREERLLRADQAVLPPCITRDRISLDVTRTVGSAEVSEPGSNCHDDCDFGLCPYPPVGRRRFREELGEGFCRALGQRGKAPGYTQLSKKEYSEFWDQMSQRVRPRGDRPGLRPLG